MTSPCNQCIIEITTGDTIKKHRELISIYYKEDIYGSRAEVYRIKGKPFENTYSIAYFNSNDARLRTKHFTNSSIEYVENIAENWALGA